MSEAGTYPLIQEQLDGLAQHYDKRGPSLRWASRRYRWLLARYYRHIIPADASVLEIGCGSGELLKLLPNQNVTGIDLSPVQVEAARENIPHGTFHVMAAEGLKLEGKFDFIILSDTINEAADVQAIFQRLQAVSRPDTRLVLNFFNNLWKPFVSLATLFGFRPKHPQCNWLASSDVRNLLELSDWEVIRKDPRILCPVPLLGLDYVINRFIAPLPLIRHLNLSIFTVARPRPKLADSKDYSVSVIVPARNEAGNIDAAIERTPKLGTHTEFIFIEGHSKDNTWEVIQQLPEKFPEHDIKIMQQTGKGKGNAVREAFATATGDILIILDADLTMPPEELPKFYDAMASGRAEYANGVRLVYPMEGEAMRFFNMLANKGFSILFSYILGQPVRDTLCGTKVLFRRDYEKVAANRAYFGDFDPFGDFDLLFGADKLNLRFTDIPIRYRNRTYGTTNIARWRNGVILLRMLAFASTKLRFI